MNSNSKLFELLQREFCPPLDSSLLMVLLAEIESDDNGNRLSPSSRQIQDLRTTLGELAAQTDQQLCQGLRNSGRSLTPTEETSSTVDFYGGEASTTCSTSSESSRHPFSSPLGFLQAVLPHIPTTKLRSALSAATTCDGEEVDMWEVVAGILTDESVRELEERGLDGLDEGEDSENVIRNRETSWETVETKKKPRATSQAGRRKNNRGVKVTLVDIRQRQHTRNNMNYPQISPAPDPWTQLSSLSDYIATLLPPHPATFFLSFFHSPKHDTPYHALCSALTSICKTKSTPSDEHNPVLFALLDILLPSYESLDSEQRSRLISDTQLSLSATGGHSDAVLDLIHLLRDLDSDSASGYLEIGVYHLPPQSLATKTKLPVGPPLIQPPPLSKIKSKSPSPSPASQKPSPFQWQAVPQRKSPSNSPHPLAQHIPAYVRDVNGIKVRGSGNGLGKGGKGDVGELSEYRRRMYESMRKRDELLREATKMWQKGTAKTRGGEIALYYADRARQFQERARTEALNAARTMVESRRMDSRDHDTLDLHGTTAAEAIAIVQETLREYGTTPKKPLKIITGRGTHSVNKIGVLKPAIKKALVEEGWSVGSWDGGLIVHGKRRPVA